MHHQPQSPHQSHLSDFLRFSVRASPPFTTLSLSMSPRKPRKLGPGVAPESRGDPRPAVGQAQLGPFLFLRLSCAACSSCVSSASRASHWWDRFGVLTSAKERPLHPVGPVRARPLRPRTPGALSEFQYRVQLGCTQDVAGLRGGAGKLSHMPYVEQGRACLLGLALKLHV